MCEITKRKTTIKQLKQLFRWWTANWSSAQPKVNHKQLKKKEMLLWMNQLFYCWVRTAGQQFAKSILSKFKHKFWVPIPSLNKLISKLFGVYILVSKLYIAWMFTYSFNVHIFLCKIYPFIPALSFELSKQIRGNQIAQTLKHTTHIPL